MSVPFVARARLRVVGSSCRFAGVMPAPKPHSERLGVDRRHRSYHEYRLTRNVTCLHIGAEEMSASFRYARATSLPPHSSCPDHVSKRSEAPQHVSADVHPCCVPLATVCLLVLLAWTDIVFRDWKDRSERVLCVRLASLARLTTPVAEKLKDSDVMERSMCRRWPLGVDLWLVGARSTRASTSNPELLRSMVAASIPLLHAWLVST